VSYDVAAIGPFVDALESAARRACVAVLMERNPASVAAPFWPLVHGEERESLPALPAFLELLSARGAKPDARRIAGERRVWSDRDELLEFLRRQLWTVPGSAADERLLAAVPRMTEPAIGGGLELTTGRTLDIGVVTWAP
jgi:hypothetical protein